MANQSINPQPDDVGCTHRKNKRPRPFVFEWRIVWHNGEFGKWCVYGRYRTAAERDQALEQVQRKHGSYSQFRIPNQE